MKINWGTSIAVFYISFVVFIGVMVYKAFGENFDLVTEDYYAQEIKFQGKIDSKQRAAALETSLQASIKNENVIVHFPQKTSLLEGSIMCFRPSDETKDFQVVVNTENGEQSIPLSQFSSGKYLIKVEWKEANGKDNFYQEQTIIIP